jgi:hypothetical protein
LLFYEASATSESFAIALIVTVSYSSRIIFLIAYLIRNFRGLVAVCCSRSGNGFFSATRQAYSLILGTDCSRQEYLVYSKLMLLGFKVVCH